MYWLKNDNDMLTVSGNIGSIMYIDYLVLYTVDDILVLDWRDSF